MPRPLYTPEYQIQTALFTAGGEFQIPGERSDYIGFYHVYPNGSIYTGAQYDSATSQELIRLPGIALTPMAREYYDITGRDYSRHTAPVYYLPVITAEDRRRGTIIRFIAQQRNDHANITEIDVDQFNSINQSNQLGIDADRYQALELIWTISGPRDDVQKANTRALVNAEFADSSDFGRRVAIPGIRIYLSDPLEFYR
jgi:hypothetical protein